MKSYILAIITALLITLVSIYFHLFASIDQRIYDYFMSDITPHKSIVVVGIDDKSLQKLGQWPWDRQVYVTALNNLLKYNPSVVGMDILLADSSQEDEKFLQEIDKIQKKLNIVWVSKIGEINIEPTTRNLENYHYGYGNIITDNDGKIRKYILQTDKYDSFAYEIIQLYLNGIDTIHVPDNTIIIHYVPASEDWQYISFYDLYTNNINIELKDKIILIGVTEIDQKDNITDNFISPNTGKPISGVYIHANALNTLLSRSYIQDASLVVNFSIALGLIVIVSIIWFFLPRFRYFTVLFPLATAYFMLYIYVHNNIRLFITPISFSGFITWFALFAARYTNSLHEQRLIERAFTQYVNATLLNELKNKGSKLLQPCGTTQKISVMMLDIVGFTTLSESITSQQLVTLLNEYLQGVSEIILKNNGLIDKYIGDAVMAFWGAPIKDKFSAYNACKSGLEILQFVKDFNKKKKYLPISIGIGINYGPATVGNLGSYLKFDYTAMGNTVNVASRAESITRKYKVDFIITDRTLKKLQREEKSKLFTICKLDEVLLKGKHQPVTLYHIMGYKDSKLNTLKMQYQNAFRQYQMHNFEKVLDLLKNIINIYPPASVLVERIKLLQSDKKQLKAFNGIWKWTSK